MYNAANDNGSLYSATDMRRLARDMVAEYRNKKSAIECQSLLGERSAQIELIASVMAGLKG